MRRCLLTKQKGRAGLQIGLLCGCPDWARSGLVRGPARLGPCIILAGASSMRTASQLSLQKPWNPVYRVPHRSIGIIRRGPRVPAVAIRRHAGPMPARPCWPTHISSTPNRYGSDRTQDPGSEARIQTVLGFTRDPGIQRRRPECSSCCGVCAADDEANLVPATSSHL